MGTVKRERPWYKITCKPGRVRYPFLRHMSSGNLTRERQGRVVRVVRVRRL